VGVLRVCLFLLFKQYFKTVKEVQKIVIEIGKPCSTMQKIMIEIVFEIVIEICTEQTWLFQCNPFHYADFCD